MAKIKTIFACSECGGISPKWLGQCPHCHAWNTLEESRDTGASFQAEQHRYAPLATASPLRSLSDVEALELPRMSTGIPEFDRVLGGGLVAGAPVNMSGVRIGSVEDISLSADGRRVSIQCRIEKPVTIAARVAVEPSEQMERVEIRRLDRSEQFGMIASREAWKDAGSSLRVDKAFIAAKAAIGSA